MTKPKRHIVRNLLTATLLLVLLSCFNQAADREARQAAENSITATVSSTSQIPANSFPSNNSSTIPLKSKTVAEWKY